MPEIQPHTPTPTSETLSRSVTVDSPALDFAAKHPWLTVSAATATGVLLGRASRRLPGGVQSRARSAAGSIVSIVGAFALRRGLAIGVQRVVQIIRENTNNKEDHMEEKSNNGRTPTTTTDEPGRMSRAKQRAGDAVDSATSQIGRGMQRATEGVSRAGQYLEETSPSEMGGDLTEMIRKHPKKSIAIGVGLGFLVSRLLSR
jgi:ElaB/YqjD/DUF883 family membrane-anchored ribosome-binding protein